MADYESERTYVLLSGPVKSVELQLNALAADFSVTAWSVHLVGEEIIVTVPMIRTSVLRQLTPAPSPVLMPFTRNGR